MLCDPRGRGRLSAQSARVCNEAPRKRGASAFPLGARRADPAGAGKCSPHQGLQAQFSGRGRTASAVMTGPGAGA
ncbi:hypothetical protein NDU88_002342 [Pleurodeles waltl]|uniref:Uncharacterized protein n=1 Tax=Pleurodeles waltl TaxID=8319 RepID=A0AAV7UAU7_PLEWA|nr:hypothetical protein NDU88_002342 [Pleurodeles waltl]